MDIVQLAAQVVTALIPLTPFAVAAGEAFAKKAGESALDGAKTLFKAVRTRFSHEPQETAVVVQQFEQNPQIYSGALEAVLVKVMEADPIFAAELHQLLQQKSTLDMVALGESVIAENKIKLRGSATARMHADGKSQITGNEIDMES